jgi:hypothetical protein
VALWLGVPDAVTTIEGARALDPVREELRTLKNALLSHIGVDKKFDAATLEAPVTTDTLGEDDLSGTASRCDAADRHGVTAGSGPGALRDARRRRFVGPSPAPDWGVGLEPQDKPREWRP